MKFSRLEKNDKTYIHIIEYYKAIQNGVPLIEVDNLLQQRELEEHLKRCNLNNSYEEIQRWIEYNAINFRIYLNSLKVFTLFIWMDNLKDCRENISKEILYKFIDLWNIEKETILEAIRF